MSFLSQIASVCSCECAVSEGVGRIDTDQISPDARGKIHAQNRHFGFSQNMKNVENKAFLPYLQRSSIPVRDAIRTRDLPLRRRTLYPAELRKHIHCAVFCKVRQNEHSAVIILYFLNFRYCFSAGAQRRSERSEPPLRSRSSRARLRSTWRSLSRYILLSARIRMLSVLSPSSGKMA